MARNLTRLTEPLVRENGALRPATWDEALDRAADGLPRGGRRGTGRTRSGIFSCSKATNEVNFLAQKFARVGRRQQQHRQLQPDLTRPQRRRSGDGLRSGRRDELLPRGRGDGRHPPVGIERARDAPDLLPPRPEGGAQRRAALRGRSAADGVGPVGRRLARPRRRHRHRARQRHGARDHRTRASRTSAFIERATTGFEAYRGVASSRTRSSARERDHRRAGGRDPRGWRTPTRAPTAAMICWTLGITEHHNAVDNVLALINLALLTGHVGPLRLGPQSAARPEQRAGRRRHGRASRTSCPGFQDVEDDAVARASSSAAWGVDDPAEARLAPDGDVRGDGARRADRALRDRREPGAVRGRPAPRAARCSRGSSTWSCRTSS